MPNKKLPDFDKLAPLNKFSPKAFISDNQLEQEVCNFILSLSIIYNDFKDLTWAFINLGNADKDAEPLTSYNGQYGGFKYHLEKSVYALLNELIKLIKENENTMKYPLFNKVFKLLSKNSRSYWQSLVDISNEKEPENKVLKHFYMIIRHKISYHVDGKCMLKGYKNAFLKDNPDITKKDACVSLGNDMASTRFYFADAAIEGFLESEIGDNRDVLANEINNTIKYLNYSLSEIITKFVTARGCSYSKIK